MPSAVTLGSSVLLYEDSVRCSSLRKFYLGELFKLKHRIPFAQMFFMRNMFRRGEYILLIEIWNGSPFIDVVTDEIGPIKLSRRELEMYYSGPDCAEYLDDEVLDLDSMCTKQNFPKFYEVREKFYKASASLMSIVNDKYIEKHRELPVSPVVAATFSMLHYNAPNKNSAGSIIGSVDSDEERYAVLLFAAIVS